MDLNEILRAEHRIRPFIRETPLESAAYLNDISGASVYFKLENLQHTGSFKARGALNKLLSLTPEQRERGVVAASSGNHGAAVAFGMRRLGIRGKIFVPEDASPAKISAIRRLDAEVELNGPDCVVTEKYARQFADENCMIYLSPYNDPQVIAGQGTIAVELHRQLEQIDEVFIALGGGGMISGIAVYLKAVLGSVKIIGCSPENSPVMSQSVKAGRILDMESLPTFSDGTAGGVEADAITFPLCQQYVDEFVEVSEKEIIDAFRQFLEHQHLLVEGAAAVPIAAFLKNKSASKDKTAVIILCGANIGLADLKAVL